jgi:putative ATPase
MPMSSTSAFSLNPAQYPPLAERMRPRSLQEYIGQTHLLAPGKPLCGSILAGRLHSMIFWGPPGTGKTTLARLVAAHADAEFRTLSAVLSGVKDIREQVAEARRVLAESGRRTLLFVDEVHRFNKSQQDAFLPHVEDGTFCFIGATTENPSFELNNALLSRARVYVLRSLTEDDLLAVMEQALTDAERGYGLNPPTLSEEVKRWFARAADGDARKLLNLLEITVDLLSPDQTDITPELAREVLAGGGVRRFDKQGEAFYNQISALHKSVRGSAPDAALYWLCRMLDGGCDPLYLARRILRIASEDIGNADPRGLELALNAYDVQERLGSPEGELALAQAVVYLACAPKSNAVYLAWKAARADAAATGSLEVPVHLRNAPTALMKQLDYGRAYRYAHDEPDAYVAGENYFPEALGSRRYYQPVPRGLEIRIAEKLARLRALDESR